MEKKREEIVAGTKPTPTILGRAGEATVEGRLSLTDTYKYHPTHHIQTFHLETTALYNTPGIGVDSWLSCVTLKMSKHEIPAPKPQL